MTRWVIDPAGPNLRRVAAVMVASLLLLAACGGDEEPELTFEDRLVALRGQALTPAEVAERAEVGQTLCLLDDRILDELWQQLSDEQLEFQDIVIMSLCPERAILYAGHTGRFVTEEAEQSGVRTSTTRPTSTTSPVISPTTTRPSTTSTGADGTSASTDPGSSSTDPGSSSTSSSSSSSSAPTSSRPTNSVTTTTIGTSSTT